MNDPIPTEPRPAANRPGAPVIPPALRVKDWLDPGMIEFGACPALTTARTVQEAAGLVREMLNRVPDCYYFLPAVFVGANGRAYIVEVDVVVRFADVEEIHEAAARALEEIKDAQVEPVPVNNKGKKERAEVLAERAAILNSYLSALKRYKR